MPPIKSRSGAKKRQADVGKQQLRAKKPACLRKKQADFKKVKTKPGKYLPVGTNITNTSFKSKQIDIRPLKDMDQPVSLNDLLSTLLRNQPDLRVKTLHKIINHVELHKESLPQFCGDIFKRVTFLLLDYDHNVRFSTIKLIDTCCTYLNERQFETFINILSLGLCPMMNHNLIAINRDALNLMQRLLHHHPSVLCTATKLLDKLLGMISTIQVDTKERKLKDVVDGSVTADQWRQEVFTCIRDFMRFKLKVQEPKERQEFVVHWNGDSPLYLPLYRNSGPKPAPLSDSWSNEDSFDTLKDLKEFLQSLVPLLKESLKGKIRTPRQKFDSHTSTEVSEKNQVSLIVELLSLIGEWVKQSSFTSRLEPNLFSALQDMCVHLMKNFPYQITPQKKSFCLNLSICHMYAMFVLDTPCDSLSVQTSLRKYLETLFTCYNTHAVPEACVSLVLKFSKIAIQSETLALEFKNALLFGLYGIMESSRLSKSAEKIFLFFIEISNDDNLSYLSNTPAMITWFKSLVVELDLIMKSEIINEIDRKFLLFWRQLCAGRQPHLMEVANKIPSAKILELLQFDDEGFQMAVISLITNLGSLSSDFMQDLAELIHSSKLSKKISRSLIRLLHDRCSRSNVPLLEQLEFVKLLLNLACDTLPIMYSEEVGSSEIDRNMAEHICDLQKLWQFHLFPSRTWESHREFFEMCMSCLTPYLKNANIMEQMVEFMKDLMCESTPKIPVHTAIALLELQQRMGSLYDEDLTGMILDLIFSGLVYMSIVTSEVSSDCLGSYSLQELERSLNLEFMDHAVIINIMELNIYSFTETDLFYAFRIIAFLARKGFLHEETREMLYSLIHKMSDICNRSKDLHSRFITICQLCGFA